MRTVLIAVAVALFSVWTVLGLWLLSLAWADAREQRESKAREAAALRRARIEPDDIDIASAV